MKIFNVLAVIVILAGCAGSKPPPPEVFTPPVFKSRPEIVLIKTVPDVYYVKEYVNIFFHNNFWYYYSYRGWYASSSYNGPWVAIEDYQLPVRFGLIPAGHTSAPINRDKKPDSGSRDRNGINDDDNGPP